MPRRSSPGAVALPTAACRPPSPIPTGATPIHKLIEQAGDQRAGLPADRRRDDWRGDAPAGLRTRSRSSTARAGRRSSTPAACTTPAIAARTTTPACSSKSCDDENARKGYCLYKMGCHGPVTYNACSVTKWNDGVPAIRSSRATAASAAAKKASGTTARSISTWPRSPASASRARPTRSARLSASPRVAGAAARGRHQHPQATDIDRRVHKPKTVERR